MISIKNGRKCPKQTVSSKNKKKWTSVYRPKRVRSHQKTNKGVQSQTVSFQKRTKVSKIRRYRPKMDFGVSSKKSTVTSKNEQRCPKSDGTVRKRTQVY